MNLQAKNRIDTGFSMTTMTDLVFLLLIFFILMSSFVTPSGLPVDFSSDKGNALDTRKATVTLTSDLQYFVNDKPVTKGTLEGELKSRLGGSGGVVILNIDKSVAAEHLIYVAGIATAVEAKFVIAN